MNRSHSQLNANLRKNKLFLADRNGAGARPVFVSGGFLHWLVYNFSSRKMRLALVWSNKQAVLIFIFLRRWKGVGENFRRHIVMNDIFDHETKEKGKLIKKIVLKSFSNPSCRKLAGTCRILEGLNETTYAYERALFTHKTRGDRNLFVDKNVLQMLVF